MARRKSKLMADSDDSSGSDGELDLGDDGDFDPNEAAEGELFRDPYGRNKKRKREDMAEESTYGIWAETTDDGGRRQRAGTRRTKDYTSGVSFVSASSSKANKEQAIDNLAPMLEDGEDDGEAEMDVDDSDEDGSADSSDEDDEQANEEDEELAPIPGLKDEDLADPDPEEVLDFAPRGLGSRPQIGLGAKPRGGLGSSAGLGMGRGGLGSRGGIGAPAATGAAPMFASASAATTNVTSFTPQGPSGVNSPMQGAATPRTGLGAGREVGKSLADSLRERLASEAASSQSERDSTPESAAPPRERRSFLPSASSVKTPGSAPAKLSSKEQQHFAKLSSSGSLGLKMLEKMGWKSGTGLGSTGQGIITPIGEGTKVRPEKMGLAYGGRGERTSGALEEARRRGEIVDDEPEKGSKRDKYKKTIAGAPPKEKQDAWKQPSKKRERAPKAVYKSYDELVAEVGEQPAGVGLIVDLSGNALPSQSLSSLPAFGAGSADPTQLPELRHNMSLLSSTFTAALSALGREGKGIQERRAHVAKEEARVRKAVERQEESMAKLKSIIALLAQIKEKSTQVAQLLSRGTEDPAEALDPLDESFDALLGQFPEEYAAMHLDDVVVGTLSPILRSLWRSWDPLVQPAFTVPQLKRWRKHFVIDQKEAPPSSAVDIYGGGGGAARMQDLSTNRKGMSSYESMMWNIWLPKVRSAVNNWDPFDPTPMLALFKSWLPLLPAFLRDNVLDQLILPKISKSMADWSASAAARGGPSLHILVFPWLEHAGPRMNQLLDEAKRKVRSWLKSWSASKGVPEGLSMWQDAFPSSDWNSLMLKYVLPQLGSHLRDRFTVNPKEQDMKPLEDVLAWEGLVTRSMLNQLLEAGFVPQWLDALYVWLTHEPNFEQVSEWYTYWKSYFPESVGQLKAISRGFRKGLDLMNQAMALGDDARYRLKRPSATVATPAAEPRSAHRPDKKPARPDEPQEVSFRTIVEEIANENNLLFRATGKVDDKGRALFRVSDSVGGRGGVTVYLESDIIWLQEKDKSEFIPVGIEEMVNRALPTPV